MKRIELTKGMFAEVDDDDYETVSNFKWHYTKVGYAARDVGGRKNKKKLYLHRFLLGVSGGEIVDHADGNKLNNSRSNLRITDKKGNQRNQGLRSDNTSGYKGVYWGTGEQRWKAQITVDQKRMALGTFKTKEDAALAYNKAAEKYHGNFAFINDIKGDMHIEETSN